MLDMYCRVSANKSIVLWHLPCDIERFMEYILCSISLPSDERH